MISVTLVIIIGATADIHHQFLQIFVISAAILSKCLLPTTREGIFNLCVYEYICYQVKTP